MPRPSVFGPDKAGVVKYLHELSEQHKKERKPLSLRYMTASVRFKFPHAPRRPRGSDTDPLKFAVYRLVRKEKIWFSRPGKTPIR